jgi:uncharacterized protein YggE
MSPSFRGRPAGLLSAVLIAYLVPAMALAEDKRSERAITIAASGSVSVEPDVAHIATGVVSEADTAREAVSRNSAAMKRVIEGLKSAGIAAKDIQTTSFSVEPRYEHPKDQSRPPAIVGYRVVNQVRIIARDLARLGEVLDQSVTLGANQLGGIHFEASNAEALKDEARRQAMANAQRRATLYAEAAGVELGHVLTISEETYGPSPRPMARAAMAAEAVPIERGSVMLEVRVNVSWALE